MSQDFGVKLALPGSDVATAADYQLLFNSSWPNIKIAANPTVQIVSEAALSANNFIIYNHNLGFIPPVIPYSGFPTTAEIGELNVGEGGAVVSVDNQNVYFVTVSPPSS